MPNYPRACRALLTVTLAVLLAACGHKSDTAQMEGNAQGFVPPAPIAVKPMPGQATLTSLDAYIGHVPHDPVDGVLFFDRTDVSTALVAAVKVEKVRREFREGSGPAKPIFERGNSVGIWACAAKDCAAHNWAFFLDRDTGKGEACYHDAATMGTTSHWYAGRYKPVVRAGACPSA